MRAGPDVHVGVHEKIHRWPQRPVYGPSRCHALSPLPGLSHGGLPRTLGILRSPMWLKPLHREDPFKVFQNAVEFAEDALV